jgi:uncharacterized protein (DUF433 family)
MSNHWWEHIDTNPLVMSGTPMVKGVPVWQVMKVLAHALSVEEVTRAYPHLTTDDLQAAFSLRRGYLSINAALGSLVAVP